MKTEQERSITINEVLRAIDASTGPTGGWLVSPKALSATIEAGRASVSPAEPNDGSCDICGCIPTRQTDLCREHFEMMKGTSVSPAPTPDLLEAMKAIEDALHNDKGSYFKLRAYLDKHNRYHGNLESEAVILEVAQVAIREAENTTPNAASSTVCESTATHYPHVSVAYDHTTGLKVVTPDPCHAPAATESALCQFCKQPMTDNGNGVFTCDNKGCKAPQYNGATEPGTAQQESGNLYPNGTVYDDATLIKLQQGEIEKYRCEFELLRSQQAAREEGLQDEIEMLRGELKAIEDGSGLTNVQEQHDAHVAALEAEIVKIASPTDSEREWAGKAAACIAEETFKFNRGEEEFAPLPVEEMADLILAHLPRGRRESLDKVPGGTGECTSCLVRTIYICPFCKIKAGKIVWLCEKPDCREQHEATGKCSRTPAPPESKPTEIQFCRCKVPIETQCPEGGIMCTRCDLQVAVLATNKPKKESK